MHPVIRDDIHQSELRDLFRMEATKEPQSRSAYVLFPTGVTNRQADCSIL